MFDVKKTQVFILVFVAFFVGTGNCNKHVKRSFDPRNHTAWPKDMESVCGISMSRNKIVGGRNAAIGDYPWQARIHANVYGKTIFHCGGSLITKEIVVTAAHCVKLYRPLTLENVILGEYDSEQDVDCDDELCADCPQIFAIKAVYYMKKAEVKRTFRHDIGLIKLDRPAKISDFVRPVCLPFGDLMKRSFLNEKTEVSGFGIVNTTTGATATKMQVLEIPIQPLWECTDVYMDNPINDKYQICAGREAGHDSCGGDSGGPMVKALDSEIGIRYFLIGVVSYGDSPCNRGYPAVYTRVTAYMRWILDTIERNQ